MAELFNTTTSGAAPLPRCCPRHEDWATLSQHLFEEFPELAIGDVVREIGRAKAAVDNVALPDDEALAVGELIARHQLLVLAGRLNEVARLDPEQHQQRVAKQDA